MSYPSHRRRWLPVLLFTGLALLAGTLGAGFEAQAKKGRAKAPAAEVAGCKTDADCVAVVDDCCPCSEGGKQHSIPKKEQAAYEKERRTRCKGTMCTEVMSQDPSCSQKPFCGAGICELTDPPADAKP
jgi:hypothetical protein